MKIAFKIWLLILAITINSCQIFHYAPSRNIRKQFTNCYSGKNTGIESKLNINGYFRVRLHREYLYENQIERGFGRVFDTLEYRAIFFPDGTFVYDIYPNYFPVGESLTQYGYARWMGIYILKGDTIKVQFINHPARLAQTWMAYEEYFKIIDRNNIILIPELTRYIKFTPEEEKLRKSQARWGVIDVIGLPSYFVETDSIPPDPNTSWLKNEDWFWCDENKFDEWKASLKSGK